mgnify:FL=1|jgi:hypothetical protein
MAWTLPENALPGAAEKIAGLITPVLKTNTVHDRDRKSLLGPLFNRERAAAIRRATVTHLILERFYLLRCYRPGGWQLSYRISEGEHIEAALVDGHGALLWVMPFRYSDLVTADAPVNFRDDVSASP